MCYNKIKTERGYFMPQGVLSEKNTRTCLTIPKELKAKLQELAQQENRSFNNLVITVLIQYVENSREE